MIGRHIALCAAWLSTLAAGLATGQRIYYLLAAILLLLPVLSALSAFWTLATLRYKVDGVRGEVRRGDTMMIIFTVRHASLLPVSSINLEMSVPSAFAPTQEISVYTPPFVTNTFRHMILCSHRGLYQAGVTAVSVSDIFGLFRFTRRRQKGTLPMQVRPLVSDANALDLGSSDMGPETRSYSTEDNASPSDTRKWIQGDELKKVHWKLSLRKRELMVRTFEESARPDTLIIPDLSEITALKDERLTFEDSICEVCLGSAKAQLEAGYPVRVPLTSSAPSEIALQSVADLENLSDAMMRVKFDSPYGYEQVLMLMLARMQRTGGAILVTSRLSTRIADIAMRMQRSGIATRVMWIADDAREESLEMLERIKMIGVETCRVNPWIRDKGHSLDETDDYDVL